MADVIDSLLVELGLDADRRSFEQGASMFNQVRSAALQFTAAVGGGMGLQQLTLGFAQNYDQLGRFSTRLGTAADYVDYLGYAMGRVGGDARDAHAAIENVQGLLDDFRMGDVSALTEASRWGFDTSAIVEARDMADAMERVSAAAAAMQDPHARRNALEALGFRGSAINLLSEGDSALRGYLRDAEDLSRVTDEMIRVSQTFNDELGDLSRVMGDLTNQISVGILPELTEATRRFREFLGEHDDTIVESASILFNDGPVALGEHWGSEARRKIGEWASRFLPSDDNASQAGQEGWVRRLDESLSTMSPSDLMETLNRILGVDQGAISIDDIDEPDAGASTPEIQQPSVIDQTLPSASKTVLMEALAMVESSGRHRDEHGRLTTNPRTGAMGRYQIMPDTARDPGFGVDPLRDHSQQEHRRFAEDYLSALLEEFGSLEMALAAYNWGPGNVRRHGEQWRDHAPDETLAYVPKVLDEIRSAADRIGVEWGSPREMASDMLPDSLFRRPDPRELAPPPGLYRQPDAAQGRQERLQAEPAPRSITFHIHDARDPQAVRREVARLLQEEAEAAARDFREPYV